MARKNTIGRPLDDVLIPIRNLQGANEIDAILGAVANGTRKQVHEAIENVLKGWPGRKRFEIWERLRWLRNGHRNHRWRHSVWSEEDVELLRSQYSHGRAGARRSVKVLLTRHPDWRPATIWRKAAKLELSTHSGSRRPWSKDDEAKLLWDGGMKAVRVIARKLNRSEASIRQRLSRAGASARVREPKHFTLHRISEMLGVSDSIVRVWFEKGLLGRANGHVKRNGQSSPRALICREALIAFCIAHPEKVNAKRCDPEVVDWLEERKIQPRQWNGCRQHLTERKECPRCGRAIDGNAFSWHVMHCTGSPPPQKPCHHSNGHIG
ncbi:MAG TPA: hypothetical protein VGX94_01300 [Terriglobia bacterium]|nr:hypothetical protein [Terriglobia bacterium]